MIKASSCGSIYELVSLDLGAVQARDGFALQNQVAAGFCIDLPAV
jgi:hypothetical protein